MWVRVGESGGFVEQGVEVVVMGKLVEELEPLEDPRHGNAERHSLHDILVIALCTILCGGKPAPTWPSLAGPSGNSWSLSSAEERNPQS